MAKVYLAEQIPVCGPRRWCAVKIPDPKYRNTAEFRRMFQTEAALAARICHPHVCGALETGDWLGTPFFAMELLRGRSLLAVRKVINPGAGARQHALRIARIIADACEGLQAIHDYGATDAIPARIVHRDISPDNLFLTNDGFVKILDLGLAQTALIEDDGDPDLLRGKISYIAPELLHREPATSRSDVWGLGIVAWELLTGRPLFNEATDYETLIAVREQAIAAPSELVPELPPEVDVIILRALQREPAGRFESAAEFGRALWNFMIAQQEVIQHSDLAEWLTTLFSKDSDVFASLCSMDVPELMDEICPAVRAHSQTSGVAQTAADAAAQTTGKQLSRVTAVRGLLIAATNWIGTTVTRLRVFLQLELSPRSMLQRLRIVCAAKFAPLLADGQRNAAAPEKLNVDD